MGTAPRARNLLHFPHSVLLPSLVVAPLLLSFWTLHPQSLWWRRGGRCYYCCSSYYLFHYKYHPLLLSEPLDHLMTKTFVGWFSRTAIFLRWLVISICAGAFPESHTWPILTMVQLPHVFVSSRTPHVLEYPRGLLLEPVISKTGFAHPVDRFRLSLSGCFNYICVFVWRNLLQLAPSSHQNSFFQIIGLQILVCCLHLVCWISVCWMQALVCCLHLVCRIWYAVCIWYAGFIFASLLL